MDDLGALATREEFLEYPEDAVRPFDMERGGTVLSDGGAAIVLQSEKFQKLTGDRVYCETAGFGQTCDANHILRPTEEGIGLQRAIREALEEAGLDVEKDKIDLFNCHATSTPLGDASEAEAIFKLIGEN